ncbi:MAG: hypothetical protein KBS65_04120 [Prevotella sp.]|nr:hypothetical protein [Candidatus Equicola stercoris]
MKKTLYLVFFFCLTLLTGNVLAQETEAMEDKKLSLTISGEFDASIKNYSKDRFATPQGPVAESSAKARIPSFDIQMQYQFAPKWKATADVEFVSESNIQVDEISLTRDIIPEFNVKAGMFILPIGHCNNGYTYFDYFTAGDPECDFSLIPCPFIETGVSFLGELKCGLSYQASFTTAMTPTNYTSEYWTQYATQGFFRDESFFSSPALSLNIGYEGIKNLKLNTGIYYCANTAKNMSLYSDYKEFCLKTFNKNQAIPVTILFADGQYRNDYFTARASVLKGFMGGTYQLTSYYGSLRDLGDLDKIDGLEYVNGVIGKQVFSYMGEVGLNLKNCFYKDTKGPDLIPFIHYECYDSEEKVESELSEMRNPCSRVNMWSFGLNWRTFKNIAVKSSYTTRRIGRGCDNMNSANEFTLALAYSFDF